MYVVDCVSFWRLKCRRAHHQAALSTRLTDCAQQTVGSSSTLSLTSSLEHLFSVKILCDTHGVPRACRFRFGLGPPHRACDLSALHTEAQKCSPTPRCPSPAKCASLEMQSTQQSFRRPALPSRDFRFDATARPRAYFFRSRCSVTDTVRTALSASLRIEAPLTELPSSPCYLY